VAVAGLSPNRPNPQRGFRIDSKSDWLCRCLWVPPVLRGRGVKIMTGNSPIKSGLGEPTWEVADLFPSQGRLGHPYIAASTAAARGRSERDKDT
jgi:hypothetical protein